MAQEIFSFFDSTVNDERSYTEREMALALGTIGGNGVRTLDDLTVTAAQQGLQAQVGVGRAMVEGYSYALLDDGGEPMLLAHEAALTQPRIDRVVLRLDKSAEVKSIRVAVKQGTAAAAPQPPELTRGDTVYEVSLAQVRIAVGAGTLRDEDITDERADEAVCGTLDRAYRAAKDSVQADDYTAAKVLTKLKSVDGASSGLDADLLDGQQGTYYAKASDLTTQTTALTSLKGQALRRTLKADVEIPSTGWTYTASYDRYHATVTVTGVTTAMTPMLIMPATNAGPKCPVYGCRVNASNTVQLFAADIPTLFPTATIWFLEVG